MYKTQTKNLEAVVQMGIMQKRKSPISDKIKILNCLQNMHAGPNCQSYVQVYMEIDRI